MNGTRRTLFADVDDAVRHLAPAQSAKTDSAGRFDLARLILDGAAFRVTDQGGEHLAAYVLQPFGRALWITAAAGRAGVPLCPIIAAHAVDQAGMAGFDRVMFRTERRGLVARTRRLGFELVRQVGPAYYMNKEIR